MSWSCQHLTQSERSAESYLTSVYEALQEKAGSAIVSHWGGAEHTLTRRGTFSNSSWLDASSGTREKLDSMASARDPVLTACSEALSCKACKKQ